MTKLKNKTIDTSKGIMKKYSLVNLNYEMLSKINEVTESRKKWIILKKLLKNKLALVGIIMFILLLLLSLIMPLIFPSSNQLNVHNIKDIHIKLFQSGHPFGTDYLGRDINARIWAGLRFSFGLAAMAVLVDLIVGYVFGILMGYFTIIDRIGQFIIKIFVNVPSMLILILITLSLRPSFWTVVLGITLTGWIGMALQVRSQVLKFRNDDWVIASKVLGTSDFKIAFSKMFKHILPIVIVQLIFTIPLALVGDLSLAILGLAIPNVSSLGSILNAGQKFIAIYPLESIMPVLLSIFVLTSIQFIGFGMQKAVGGNQ